MKATKIMLRVITILSLVGVVVFAFLLWGEGEEYREGRKAYEDVRQGFEEGKLTPGEEPVDFSALKEVNDDIVGWIQGEGIDYPIVRTADNEFYLLHLFDGSKNKMGTIFVDYRNSADFSDKNTLVYGHNIKGRMFSPLTKYKKQAQYDRFPEMILYTPTGNYAIALFAGVVTAKGGEFMRLAFNDDEEFFRFSEEVKEKSTFKSDVSLAAGDQIITLFTCSYEFTNARYAVFGKLIPLK